jgi:alpha 1,3-mannosyltransferase
VHYKLIDGKAEIINDYQPPSSPTSDDQEIDEEAALPIKRDSELHSLYTVSSPQLLHLDLNDRPLWFNGWILDDKFEDNKHVNVSTWDVYLSEIKETREAAEWRIGGHNMATLKSNKAFEFTEKEKEVLQMIVDTARENGSLLPGQ